MQQKADANFEIDSEKLLPYPRKSGAPYNNESR